MDAGCSAVMAEANSGGGCEAS